MGMKEKAIEALKEIKTLLGMEQEVKLESMMLADGQTKIEATSFEMGSEVFIVTTDEQMIPLPIGEYELENGQMLVVVEEGLIAEIKDVVEETETPEMPNEVPTEASAEAPKAPKKTVETTTKETHFSAEEFEALKSKVAELETKLSEMKEKEVELSEEKPKKIEFNPEPKQKVNLSEMSPLERHRYIKSRMNG